MPYQGRCYLSGCAVAVPAPGQPGSAESPNPEPDPVVLHRGWEPLVLPPKQSKKQINKHGPVQPATYTASKLGRRKMAPARRRADAPA